MVTTNKYEQSLRNHKLKVTSFRLDVVALFDHSTHALTLSDIESNLNTPDRITLYRTLKSFEDRGIIHKINDGTSVQKYAMCEDSCSEHQHDDEHVHFHCTECDYTFCLDHVMIPNVNLPKGFAFSDAQMTVNGICQKCGE